MSVFEAGLALCLGAFLLGIAGLSGYAWLVRFETVRDASMGLRTVATVVAATWTLLVVFLITSAAGAFSILGTTACLSLLALLGLRDHTTEVAALARRDLAAITVTIRALLSLDLRGLATATLSVPVLVVFGVRWARSMVMPPTATDALTYHLFRAGRFVQSGGWVIEPTPDAGGYYAYYPPLGDALWAWVLLPAHGDALVAMGQLMGMATLGICGYVAARELGAPRRSAYLGALTLLATPAVLSWSTAAYVDVFLLSAWLATLAWLPQTFERPTPVGIWVTSAAMAMAVGIKTPGAGVAVAGTVPLLWAMIRRARPASPALAAMAFAWLVAAPGLVAGMIDFGNPMYPFAFLGLPGHPENMLLHRGELFSPEMVHFDLRRFLSHVFWFNSNHGVQHLNLGPASVLVLAAALLGAMRLRHRAGLRAAGVAMAVVVLLYLLKLTSDDTLVLRTSSAPAVGRFLMVPFSVAILAATRAPIWISTGCLAMASLIGAALGWPQGLGVADRLALTHAWPAAILCGVASSCALAGVIVLGRTPSRGPLRTAVRTCLVAAAMFTFAALAVCLPLRAELRTPYYQALHGNQAFDPHPTDPAATQAWPIWRALDALPQPARVAFASGWDGRGHHWYRSPLLGAQLQHEVLYISPFPGDTLVDYREDDKVRTRADRALWLQRMLDREVDILVLAVPQSVEHEWALQLPEIFVPFATGEGNLSIAFEIRRERLGAGISSPRG